MADESAKSNSATLLRQEYPLLLSVLSMALFMAFGKGWLADLGSPAWYAFMLAWLLVVILMSAFAIVRHAESLASILGEPLGTLVLTLSIIGVEVLMISAVMLSGDGNPTMARDTMTSVIMILLAELIRTIPKIGAAHHTMFGVLLIVVIIFLPNGVVGDAAKLRRLLRIGRPS